ISNALRSSALMATPRGDWSEGMKILDQLAPLSSERQIPSAKTPAYMTPEWVGSTTTCVTPRVGSGAVKILVNVVPVWRYTPLTTKGCVVEPLEDAPLVTEAATRTPLAIQ